MFTIDVIGQLLSLEDISSNPLLVEKITISADGKLRITFNKDVIWPKLLVDYKSTTQDEGRLLKD